jgi:hypothetical protein
MKTIQHKFVEYIPSTLEESILYISIEYHTAAHLCACGCGNLVVTPITPTDWKLIFDGRNVTLSPSIGNWNFKCKSHYWIKNNTIIKAPKWDEWEINSNRNSDKKKKTKYFKKIKNTFKSKPKHGL